MDGQPEEASGRSTFAGDLRVVLAEQDFRRLFATRLVSQTGDGIITAGVGTYVFFNASTFPSPSAAALAFTVLYLPYSLIGPLAGVFIDRWSRRQILVLSALIRSAFVVVTAAIMASGGRGVPLYLAVLLVASVTTAARYGWDLLPILPATFARYHLGYGVGFLQGLIDFVVRRRTAPSARMSQLTR